MNRYHETNYVLTQGGYRTLAELYDYSDEFKVLTQKGEYEEANITLSPPERFTRITEATFDNGFTNISTADSVYLTSIDSEVAAQGILSRPLKAINYINRACNDYVFAGMTVAFFQYSSKNDMYYTRPSTNKYFRHEIMCLYGDPACGRCDEMIFMTNPEVREQVIEVYGYIASSNSPRLPININSMSEFQLTSLLKGMLTVYLNVCNQRRLEFLIPTKSLMYQLSDVLNSLGIYNSTIVKRVAPTFDYLDKEKKYDVENRLIIEAGYVAKFMSLIGVMTDCALNHISDVERRYSTRATKVVNENRYESDDVNGRFFSIQLKDFNPNKNDFIIMGGVYVQIYN